MNHFKIFKWLDNMQKLFKVVLAGTNTKAVAAVKDLIYTGTCYLDKVAYQNLKCRALLHRLLNFSSLCLSLWRPWLSLGWKYPATTASTQSSLMREVLPTTHRISEMLLRKAVMSRRV